MATGSGAANHAPRSGVQLTPYVLLAYSLEPLSLYRVSEISNRGFTLDDGNYSERLVDSSGEKREKRREEGGCGCSSLGRQPQTARLYGAGPLDRFDVPVRAHWLQPQRVCECMHFPDNFEIHAQIGDMRQQRQPLGLA